jgi:hypothetical protein
MTAPQASVSHLAAALRYASLGWPVIPLHTPENGACDCGKDCGRSNGKHPWFDGWGKRATTDEAAIRGWWRTWPNANVGLVTGARSGFFVFDVDTDKGGDDSLAALPPIPDTIEAKTGSGGRHYLFKHPGFYIKSSTEGLGVGLDIKGDGGQIVAAPSLHKSGRSYEWVPGHGPDDCELASAPTWLLERLQPAIQEAAPKIVTADNATRRAQAYIARMPQAISGSRGHDSLWAVAIALCRGFRLSAAEAIALILSDYNPRCVPPWSEKEIVHKVRDAIEHGDVPFGYLLDAQPSQTVQRRESASVQASAPAPKRPEPGCDDGDEALAIKQPRFTMEKLSDLLNENIPPTKWLLSPYVPAVSFGELVGPPGKGKTTFMAWMIMQMAAAGARCAVIEEEGSRRGLQRLLSRAMEAVGSNVSDRIGFMHAQLVNLLDQRDIYELSIVLKGFDFVLFDSFNLVTPGLDEDKAKDAGPVIKDLRWLRNSLQIATWFNHHSGKSKWRVGDVPRLGDGRGSSAWPGALDCELAMRPVQDPENGFIQFDLFVTKMREADDQVRPQRVSICRTGPAAILEMSDTDRDLVPPVDAHLALEVLNFVAASGQAGVSKNQIEKNVKGNAGAIRAALMALKYSSRVEEIPFGAYTKWRAL